MSDEDPVAPLDQWLLDAAADRARLVTELRAAKGVVAEQLAVTLRQLDQKTEEAKAKRDDLRARLARANRVREIAVELRAINLEIQEELAAGGGATPRAVELQQRGEALVAEGRALVQPKPSEG